MPLGFVLTFNTARLAIGGALLKPEKSFFKLGDSQKIFTTKKYLIKHTQSINKNNNNLLILTTINTYFTNKP